MQISLARLRKIINEELEQDRNTYLQKLQKHAKKHKSNVDLTKKHASLSSDAFKLLAAVNKFVDATDDASLEIVVQLKDLEAKLEDIVKNPESYLKNRTSSVQDKSNLQGDKQVANKKIVQPQVNKVVKDEE